MAVTATVSYWKDDGNSQESRESESWTPLAVGGTRPIPCSSSYFVGMKSQERALRRHPRASFAPRRSPLDAGPGARQRLGGALAETAPMGA